MQWTHITERKIRYRREDPVPPTGPIPRRRPTNAVRTLYNVVDPYHREHSLPQIRPSAT